MAQRRQWNSTLPAPSKPIERGPGPKRSRKPIRVRGKPRFKVSGVKDEPYREYIRGLACLLTGREGHKCRGIVECAHVKAKGAGGVDRGNCIPLCARAHGESHHQGQHTFEMIWDVHLAERAKELECKYVLRDFGGLSSPGAQP